MHDPADLYEPDDYGDDTGDDCTRLKGRHTEAECRYYREEMARRRAHAQALGVGRECALLSAAAHGRLPEPAAPTPLPEPVPESRRLPAPANDSPSLQTKEETTDDVAWPG
jgi:hypothetical protein